MRQVSRNALVPFSPEQMFGLVDDVARYKEFLPWCQDSRELARSDAEVLATLKVGFEALNTEFTTRNQRKPTHAIEMALEEGPFRQLRGRWDFRAVGNVGCEVSLVMEFTFANAAQDLLLGASFEKICNQLIDAFIQRAHATLNVPDAHD